MHGAALNLYFTVLGQVLLSAENEDQEYLFANGSDNGPMAKSSFTSLVKHAFEAAMNKPLCPKRCAALHCHLPVLHCTPDHCLSNAADENDCTITQAA